MCVNDYATHNVDLDYILRFSKEMQRKYLDMFTGVKIKVDPELKGNSYYCAVSLELFDQIIAYEKDILHIEACEESIQEIKRQLED